MQLPKVVLATLIVIFFIPCDNSDARKVTELYEKRDTLIAEFKGVSVIRSRGKNVIVLSYHKSEAVNQLFFDKKANEFILTNYIYQDSAMMLKTDADSTAFKNKMEAELKRLLIIMDNLEITDVSSEFENLGIDIKFYLKGGDVLLFVSNPEAVKNENWANYLINSKKKFDSYWYYIKDE